jgi:hypothetical protein
VAHKGGMTRSMRTDIGHGGTTARHCEDL